MDRVTNNKPIYLALGGAGANTLSDFDEALFPTEQQLYVNTDRRSLVNIKKKTLLIGEKCCKGLSAGRCLIFGKNAIDESYSKILYRLKDHKVIFIIAGLGGGTGSAAPHLAGKLIKSGKNVHLIMSILRLGCEGERTGFMTDDALNDAEIIKPILSSLLVIKSEWNKDDRTTTVGDLFSRFHSDIANQVSSIHF